MLRSPHLVSKCSVTKRKQRASQSAQSYCMGNRVIIIICVIVIAIVSVIIIAINFVVSIFIIIVVVAVIRS